MKKTDLRDLQIKTAFACMVSDGHIGKTEIETIESLFSNIEAFKEVNIKTRMIELTNEINEQGKLFLKSLLREIEAAGLDEQQELSIIEITGRLILADEHIHYQEIKFFKLVRSALNVSNGTILASLPHMEQYLEQDIITGSSTNKLLTDYFDVLTIPKFEIGIVPFLVDFG